MINSAQRTVLGSLLVGVCSGMWIFGGSRDISPSSSITVTATEPKVSASSSDDSWLWSTRWPSKSPTHSLPQSSLTHSSLTQSSLTHSSLTQSVPKPAARLVWYQFDVVQSDDVQLGGHADTYKESMAADEAAALFHRRITQLRREQRAALERSAADVLAELDAQQSEWLRSGRETTASLVAWRSVAQTLQTASDLPTAVMLTSQLRSRLSPAHQQRHLELIDQLGKHMIAYRQAKRDYQSYQAAQLQQSWNKLSLAQKRQQVQSYLFLEGERPDWLHVHRPIMASLPIDRSVKDRLRTFETKRDTFLVGVQIELDKHVQTAVKKLRQLQLESRFEEPQSIALQDWLQLLDADYGRGLRGLMLCDDASELPDAAAVIVAQLMQEYRRLLSDWRLQHKQLLVELIGSLEPFRERLLEGRSFGELMAIDLAIAERSDLFKPLRIFASRGESSTAPEDCWLRDVDERGYYVEFMRDAHRAWLPRGLVHLKPSAVAPPYPLSTPPAESMPAEPFNLFNASQRYSCYTPGGWQSCQIVDVSPFGIVVQFDDLLEPVYPLVSRSCIR